VDLKLSSMALQITIGKRTIGPGRPVYVIAEVSANHHQNFEEAVKIIHAVKDADADAVKLQTYTADTITIDSDRPEFRVGGGTIWDGRNLHDLYREAYTPWDWQPKLKVAANDLGLDLFSTPFDGTAVDFLEAMDVPAHKLASFELVDLPLIRKMAQTAKPLIMSTGMASLEEIEEAVQTARQAGAKQIALLKCTSAYPAPPEEMNLRSIPELSRRFGVPAGLSDHTMAISVPVAAVALGACIIEKHITLSRSTPGPDSAFSLEPHEFKAMVHAVRDAEKALGAVHFGLGEKEAGMRAFRRSLFVVQDMKQGEPFTAENVRSIRPGHGLHTRHLEEVLGRRAARNIERGTPLSWDLLDSQGDSQLGSQGRSQDDLQ
jgi:pseudaminic acid synthase